MPTSSKFIQFPEVEQLRGVLGDPSAWTRQLENLDLTETSIRSVRGDVGMPYEYCVGRMLVHRARLRPLIPSSSSYGELRYDPTDTPGGLVISKGCRRLLELDGLYAGIDGPFVVETKVGKIHGALAQDRLEAIHEHAARAWRHTRVSEMRGVGYCIVMPHVDPMHHRSMVRNLERVGAALVLTHNSRRTICEMLRERFRPPRL